MKRILVIRGGAIGDFILTLPAVRALREAHPQAHLEILGYKHIAALAERRFYAQAVRYIEFGPLSAFFAKAGELPDELAKYFREFDLVVSYLYDPDDIFENNLRRCGVKNFVRGPAKIRRGKHAAQQLAAPIEKLGMKAADLAPKIFPSAEDRQFAAEFLRGLAVPAVALHPGSGSERKNWPVERWIELGDGFLAAESSKRSAALIVISGEADTDQTAQLEARWKNERVLFAKNLPLPRLAAVLEQTIFIGHDSGISHLAAASGAECILLFGPTDPEIWAPQNANVRVIRASSGRMENVDLGSVREAVGAAIADRGEKGATDHALMRMGIST